ncbi:MAG: MarC family protein [Minisyncoccales bacterium]
MLSNIIALLAMLNPFALFMYLQPVMEDLEHKDFLKVLIKSTFISGTIFLMFLLTGRFIFEDFFQINFESFRIFGGVIIFAFAYFFIVNGQKAMIRLRGSLDDLASEIALPFMVGAGTISVVILMSYDMETFPAIIALGGVLFINYMIITVLKNIRDGIAKKKFRVAFDKNMSILLRLNGFFLGAIGIDMIMRGIMNLFGL